MTIWGTSYFVSLKAAYDYYASYGVIKTEVDRGLREGEIHIGQPCLKQGEHLVTVDHDRRYAVISG